MVIDELERLDKVPNQLSEDVISNPIKSNCCGAPRHLLPRDPSAHASYVSATKELFLNYSPSWF